MSDHIVDANKMVSDLEATAREIVHHWMATQRRPSFRLDGQEPLELAFAVAQALQAVREADAKVAAEYHLAYWEQPADRPLTLSKTCAKIAAAIRSQGVEHA
jgi:hypothetical protein